jgi:hypothetical protein
MSSPPTWPKPNDPEISFLAMTMQIGPLKAVARACQQEPDSAQSGRAGQLARSSTVNLPPLRSKAELELRARLLMNSAATPSQSALATPSQLADQSRTFTVVAVDAVEVASGLSVAFELGVGVSPVQAAKSTTAAAATACFTLNRVCIDAPLSVFGSHRQTAHNQVVPGQPRVSLCVKNGW